MNDDLINRQQAIDEVMALPNCENGYSDTYDKGRFISLLEELPPARKRGKWLAGDGETVSGKCSVCGWEANYYETDVCGMPYCPNCGAKMESD